MYDSRSIFCLEYQAMQILKSLPFKHTAFEPTINIYIDTFNYYEEWWFIASHWIL